MNTIFKLFDDRKVDLKYKFQETYFKNYENKNLNKTYDVLYGMSKLKIFLIYLILIFSLVDICFCQSELAASLENEFKRIAKNFPEGWENYFVEITSKGHIKVDKFQSKDIDYRFIKIHQFNNEVINNFRTIVWEEYTVFKTFSFSINKNQSGYTEFIGAARIINNWIEIAYIEIDSTSILIPVFTEEKKIECRIILFKEKCEEKIVKIPRSYTLEEIEIIMDTLRANSFKHLQKTTHHILTALQTKEFVLSENSPYHSDEGNFFFLVQDDGNLVIFEKSAGSGIHKDKPIWSSSTNKRGTKPYLLVIEKNGDLVLYDSNWTHLWNPSTIQKGIAPFRLHLSNEGILTLIDGNENIIWDSQNELYPN